MRGCFFYVTMLLSLLTNARSSVYIATTRSLSRSIILHMGLGFGQNKIQPFVNQGFEENNQIAKVTIDSLCKCGSGQSYAHCCRPHHVGHTAGLVVSPKEIVRARYTAYALGIPHYLIDTSHYAHNEYIKHEANHRNFAKAYKTWCKDIVTKNSEVFEFLKFQFADSNSSIYSTTSPLSSPSTIELKQEDLSEMTTTEKFCVVARERRTSKVIAFEETSVFVKDQSTLHKISQANINREYKEVGVERPSERWFYQSGTVTAMDEQKVKHLMKLFPKYCSEDSIRDRW